MTLTMLAVALGYPGAQAPYTEGTIKIAVLNDISGTYADLSGQGSVIAARMAVEDFGAATKGMKGEIVGADHLNKPDVGSNIVRTWIDTDDVIVSGYTEGRSGPDTNDTKRERGDIRPIPSAYRTGLQNEHWNDG
jgi:branched-chain amino acid transport system substrate-binding protein